MFGETATKPTTENRVFEGWVEEDPAPFEGRPFHLNTARKDSSILGASFPDDWFDGLEGKKVRLTIEVLVDDEEPAKGSEIFAGPFGRSTP